MAIHANNIRRRAVQTLKNKCHRRVKPIMESQRSHKMKESFAFLIEDALERSEVVIAAESIIEKLQSMAEDLSTIEAKDIMPLFDALTNAFGPQVAQKFNATATEQIRQLVGAVQAAKSAMDGEILRLKQGVETGEVSDLAMDAAATPMMPSVEPGAPDPMVGGGLSDTPPAEGEVGDIGGDDLGIAGGAGPAIGRDRKESAKPKGNPLRTPRKVAEDVDMPRSHESLNFAPNLNNLALFHGGAGRLAQSIANMIRTDELSEVQRKGLASVLSHLAAFASEPAHWSGVDADKKLEMALQSAGIWKIDSPALQKIVPQLKRLTHILAAKHDGMLESYINMLRTAADPDALILKTFRVSLAENRDGQMAAIRTARTFAIDIEDVVAVVREAAARRPFKEAPEYTQQTQQVQNGQAADDMSQDIPMFPVEQGSPAQAGGALPAVPNANAVQPMTMQPANQSNSTNKPLTPADMRLRQSQQQAQTAAPQPQTPGQTPPAQAQQPNTQAMPPTPAQPTQQATTATNNLQQPQFKMPGQVINKNDPALKRGMTR